MLTDELEGTLDDLVVRTAAIELSNLTIDVVPAPDGDDELVARCLQAMCETRHPTPSHIEGYGVSDVTESSRITLDSGTIEVPLSYDERYARNWAVLFATIDAELSALRPSFRRVKRRVAADGDEELLSRWKEMCENLEELRSRHHDYAEYCSPIDELPQRIRKTTGGQ